MPISAISDFQSTSVKPKTVRKKTGINFINATGYGAIGCGIASVVAVKNKNLKWHKALSYVMGALVVAHVGILEWYHHKKN